MKKAYSLLRIALTVLIIAMIGVTSASAIPSDGLDQINAFAKDNIQQSKIPDAAIAVITGTDVEFLSFGAANIDQEALFQIGSVTKAFTGLGILLLEDEGKLALDDPITNYLPWYTVTYNGEAVPPEKMTIAQLIYQTSGFTNDEAKYPSPAMGASLEEGVRDTPKDLTFYPGEQYAYANINFNTLGLLIEVVSGQPYEDFITERILRPIGMNNTYIDAQKALETGKMVPGTRLAFWQSYKYEIPVLQAKVPAGYIISCASDMSRWLQVQMGTIQVSDQFTRIIEKSHTPNPASVVDEKTHYASGWFVDGESIYHSGGTQNYSSRVAMHPGQELAVCVLTNMNASANTNAIADNILNILEGKPVTPYAADIWLIFDTIFSLLLAVSVVVLIVLLICSTVRRKEKGRRDDKKRGKRIVPIVLSSTLVLLSAAIIVLLPQIFGGTWPVMLAWAPVSVLWGTIGFTLMSVVLFVRAIAGGLNHK